MKVVSCKINGLFFCTLFEDGNFIIEDMEVRKAIYLSKSHSLWMVKQISDLLNGSSVRFFLREVRDDSGAMRLSKFKSKMGWNLRCVVWPATGGRFFIHVPEGTAQQGWTEFLGMINSFIIRIGCYTDLSAKKELLQPSFVEVLTKGESHHNYSVQDSTLGQSNSSAFHNKQSTYLGWIRKEKEVFKEDFENLWVVSRLFAFDEWKDIVSFLEGLYQTKISINPLFADKALIKTSQGNLKKIIVTPGRWFDYRKFHLLFEKWNSIQHSRPTCIKGYGGWLIIRNLPLEYWCRATFETIGSHFGGLEDIALETLNLLNVTEAKIKVKRNLCGFMPASIEIKNVMRGSIFKILRMSKSWKVRLTLKRIFKDFINPIDQNRLSKVAEDEEACSLVSKCIRLGRFVPLSSKMLPESSEKVLWKSNCPQELISQSGSCFLKI